MREETKLSNRMRQLGYELIRSKKHHIWRHTATGKTVVTPSSHVNGHFAKAMLGHARRNAA